MPWQTVLKQINMKQLLLTLATLFTISLQAQHLELGLSFGSTSYVGDLVCIESGGHFKQFNPMVGVFAKYNYDRFSTKLGIMTSRIVGNDANSHYPERGLHFESPIREIALTGEVNIIYVNINRTSYITPYLFGGLAVYQFNPRAYYDEEWIDLQPLGTEGQGIEGHEEHYKLTQLAIPFGGGIKYKVNKRLSIGAEVGIRKLFTDYLDDVSGYEVNFKELMSENGEMAAMLSVPKSQMADAMAGKNVTYTRGSMANDMYYTCQINVSYTFGKEAQLCPRFGKQKSF
jgi:opacity protein-like surface antigen